MEEQIPDQPQEIAKKSMWVFVCGLSLGLIIASIFTGFWIFKDAIQAPPSDLVLQLEACDTDNLAQCQLQENIRQERALKIDRTIAFWTVLIGLFTLTNAALLFFTLTTMSKHRNDDIKRKNTANKAWLPFVATQLRPLVCKNIKSWADELEVYTPLSSQEEKDSFQIKNKFPTIPKKAFKQLQANIKTADPKVALDLARIFTHVQITQSRYVSTKKREYGDDLDDDIHDRLIETLLLLDRVDALYSYGRGQKKFIEPPRSADEAKYFAEQNQINSFDRFAYRWNKALSRFNTFHPYSDKS